MRWDIVVQMTLPLILNIERKDMATQVFPSWTSADECVLVLKNMTDAILKIGNAILIRVPELDVVGASRLSVAVYCRKLVLCHISVASPAPKLITIMDCDGELDASGLSFYHELIDSFELGVIPDTHGLGLNVRHCN